MLWHTPYQGRNNSANTSSPIHILLSGEERLVTTRICRNCRNRTARTRRVTRPLLRSAAQERGAHRLGRAAWADPSPPRAGGAARVRPPVAGPGAGADSLAGWPVAGGALGTGAIPVEI